MSQQNPASASARRMQFIATTRKAVRQFDEGRAPTECMRDVKRALTLLDRTPAKGGDQ
ncbi:hypothetical protein MRS76_20565 [Rhizobiaceae bacterium n13]|uniref:hypothetical protein n=1 Tax=Ferirhizobium litorale TaxID=2927786 RepID=UPI0024B31D58|nr:hypothetical protein [Fererhizobium litorale]MDI7864336.1 hypothetical protein [Fererhizobium litorale]